MVPWTNSYHFASEGCGVTGHCGRLQHVDLIPSIKDHAKNRGESFCENAYVTTRCDLIDFGGTWNDREGIKVSYIEVAVMGDCRWHDVALARRNVTNAGYLTFRCNLIQFAVVRFNSVQITADRDHAVPRSIRFKIIRLGMGDRKSHLKRA